MSEAIEGWLARFKRMGGSPRKPEPPPAPPEEMNEWVEQAREEVLSQGPAWRKVIETMFGDKNVVPTHMDIVEANRHLIFYLMLKLSALEAKVKALEQNGPRH